MTPKHHALLSSIVAIKDAASGDRQDAMSTMDDVEAGRISIEEALPKLRGNVTRLNHSVISIHDTAAVLAEPMYMATVPTSVVEAAQPDLEAAGTTALIAEPDKPASRKASAQVVRDVRTLDDPNAETGAAMNRNGGKAEA